MASKNTPPRLGRGLAALLGDVVVHPNAEKTASVGAIPIDQIDRDHYRVSNLNLAPWTSLALRLSRFTLTPSVRLESFLVSVSRSLPEAPQAPRIGRDALSLSCCALFGNAERLRF